MSNEKLLKKVLKEHGYKTTHSRLQVFKVLQAGAPQSISELINTLDTTVNRVTVYRVVDLFEKLDIIKKITIGWKYKLELSDLFSDHHHHITCLNCGRTVSIQEDYLIEQLIKKAGEDLEFSSVTHQLELQGYCKDCTL